MNAIQPVVAPVELREPPPPQPSPPSVGRLLRAVFVERRVPYRIQTAWDRLLHGIGFERKVVRLGGLRFSVRRLSWDEGFLRHSTEGETYTLGRFALRDGDTVIDVGANIGAFSVFAASKVGRGRVVAFEPASDNYEQLRRNAALNGLRNLETIRAAVSAANGRLVLYRARGSGAHSTTAGRLSVTTGTEDVEALSLDEVFSRFRIGRCQLLKLNCEGAEYDILYGASPEALARIDRIAMEYHATEDKRAKTDALIAHLRGHGFEVVEYIDYVDLDCGFLRLARSSPVSR